MDQQKIKNFQSLLFDWYSSNARQFPWRYTFRPYLVMISEVLLQQTNVKKVVEPYKIITNRWPSVESLSIANPQDLYPIFTDLGLFYRAERLVDISKQIVERYDGVFPSSKDKLLQVKGIGGYSASCIVCFGHGLKEAVVDTNVIRIMSRVFGFQSEKPRPRDDKNIWAFADLLLPHNEYTNYNYALLDFGAVNCTHYHPSCEHCCLANICYEKLSTFNA